MTQTADIVIIGGGVLGASVAYHLSTLSAGEIVLVERNDRVGQGASGKSLGIVRTLFESDVNVRMSLLSLEKFMRFREEVGGSLAFAPIGHLFVARTEEELDQLKGWMTVSRKAGHMSATQVGPKEIAEINPALRCDDLVGGVLSPTDGVLDHAAILRGYLQAASTRGATLRLRSGMAEPVVANGRVTGVKTDRGLIATPTVINTAGAWAGAVAGAAGIVAPLSPILRRVATTRPFRGVPVGAPITYDMTSGLRSFARGDRVFLQRPDDTRVDDPEHAPLEASWLTSVMEDAHHRVPSLRQTTIDREKSWAGACSTTPDGHILLGHYPTVSGFYIAAGAGARGITHAPACGLLIAELILRGKTETIDTHALRPTRFEEAAPAS